MTLGERIKYLRNKMGLTQEELAKFLSCPRGTISNWEIDRSEPDSKMLGKIANFFDVSLDYLITGKNFNAKPGIMDDLTDEEKKHVKLFIEFLKSKRQSANKQEAVSE